MSEYRRILLDGYPTVVTREGETLIANDGRTVAVEDAVHLAPTEPRKIICVHLNYKSRVDEFMTKLPANPTYFHKPVTALCGHGHFDMQAYETYLGGELVDYDYPADKVAAAMERVPVVAG